MDNQDPCPAVVEEILIVFRHQHRIGRYRNGADLHRTEKGINAFRVIRHDDRDPLLHSHTQCFERVAETVDIPGQLAVGHGLVAAEDGGLVPPARRYIIVNKYGCGVELLRQFQCRHARSFPQEYTLIVGRSRRPVNKKPSCR